MTALTAAQVAAQDQARALARDLAITTPVIFADYATGQTCIWCDCSTTAPDIDQCRGCTTAAVTVLRVYPEAEPGECWPVCPAHRDDALRVISVYLASTAAPT